jgi:hypothetical protein
VKHAGVMRGARAGLRRRGSRPLQRFLFGFTGELPESSLLSLVRPALDAAGRSSTIDSADVSGGAVESLARVRVQTAFPSSSCSTRPTGPPGRRGNFGRRIFTVSTMLSVCSSGPSNERQACLNIIRATLLEGCEIHHARVPPGRSAPSKGTAAAGAHRLLDVEKPAGRFRGTITLTKRRRGVFHEYKRLGRACLLRLGDG